MSIDAIVGEAILALIVLALVVFHRWSNESPVLTGAGASPCARGLAPLSIRVISTLDTKLSPLLTPFDMV